MRFDFSVYTAYQGYAWSSVPATLGQNLLSRVGDAITERCPEYMDDGDLLEGAFYEGGFVVAFTAQKVRNWDVNGRPARYYAVAFLPVRAAPMVNFEELLRLDCFRVPSRSPSDEVCYNGNSSLPLSVALRDELHKGSSTIQCIDLSQFGDAISEGMHCYACLRTFRLISSTGIRCNSYCQPLDRPRVQEAIKRREPRALVRSRLTPRPLQASQRTDVPLQLDQAGLGADLVLAREKIRQKDAQIFRLHLLVALLGFLSAGLFMWAAYLVRIQGSATVSTRVGDQNENPLSEVSTSANCGLMGPERLEKEHVLGGFCDAGVPDTRLTVSNNSPTCLSLGAFGVPDTSLTVSNNLGATSSSRVSK